MNCDWQQTSLGKVIELKRGYDLPQRDRRPGIVPIVSSSGVTDYHAEAMVKGPGVVTGRYGTIGQVFYIEEDFWPLNTALYVRDFKGNDPKFISYFLRSINFLAYSDKAAVPGVNRNHLHQAIVKIPPLPEQRAIASILGALDDKIELNRRMNRTLEAMAQALFQSWFVAFDPVRAKAEGRDPGLPAEIADLFPEGFEESELGEIPQGWEVGVVGDLALVSSGKRPDVKFPNASIDASIPLWGGNGPMAFVPKPLIDYPILLTGRVGTLGSVFRITSPCWPSDNTLILKTQDKQTFEYLFLQLKEIDFHSLNRGSTQPLLTQTDLKTQRVLLPQSHIISQFHVISESLYHRIDEANVESGILAALRDTLLPKLLSGELRVGGEGRSQAFGKSLASG